MKCAYRKKQTKDKISVSRRPYSASDSVSSSPYSERLGVTGGSIHQKKRSKSGRKNKNGYYQWNCMSMKQPFAENTGVKPQM